MVTIYFYRTDDEYGCFSNFSCHPIQLKGKSWPTSEHYFQAQKFAGTPMEEQIRLAESPRQAFRLGRSRTYALRADWEAVKEDVMREAVRAKFTQHAELAEILLSTGDAILAEHTPRDHYWADGGDGNGLNRLGQILMEIRHELRTAGTRMTQQEVLDLIYHARSLVEIDEAERAVDAWLQVYPNDHEVLGTAELLLRTREALEGLNSLDET